MKFQVDWIVKKISFSSQPAKIS